MSFEDVLAKLETNTAAAVLSVLEGFTTGALDRAATAELIGIIVATANAQGAAAAELSVLAWVDSLGGAPALPANVPALAHYLDDGRLTAAAHTILEGAEAELVTRMGRLASSEPVEAAQRTYGEAIERSGRATGWTRKLNRNACQLCSWWARDGAVWPLTHTMPTHNSCKCIPEPVAGGQGLYELSRGARNDSADRAAYGTYQERQQVSTDEFSRNTKANKAKREAARNTKRGK